MTAIQSTIAELHDLDRQHREFQMGAKRRAIALLLHRTPVAQRMRVLAQEFGLTPVEGETLRAFVARVVSR